MTTKDTIKTKLKEKHNFSNLPNEAGVYALIDPRTGQPVYIGQSKDINSRLGDRNHQGRVFAREQNIRCTVVTNTSNSLSSENNRLREERKLKKEFKPLYDRKKKGK